MQTDSWKSKSSLEKLFQIKNKIDSLTAYRLGTEQDWFLEQALCNLCLTSEKITLLKEDNLRFLQG
jgi:hypothetical protein